MSVRSSDVRGFARLVTHATSGLVDVVEAVHRTHGLARLVYRTVRGVTWLVGGGLDAVLARIGPALAGRTPSPKREAVLAALNGVFGDHLAATDNPLTIPMTLRRDGRTLALETKALREAIPLGGGKLAVLVHGLCRNDLQWTRHGHDHGAVLARELGYTPLYLHYNSGLHTSVNGRQLAGLLEALLGEWPHPVEELVIVAHSMGGLVARSACHYGLRARHAWPQRLRKLAFLGTPHHGVPLERGGHWLHAVLGGTALSAPFARLGRMRSAGITDLRYGNMLDEDWQGCDRFASTPDARRSVRLPHDVRSLMMAATTGGKRGDLRDRLLGDGLVPVSSALGLHEDPRRALPASKSRQWIGYRMNHLDLLSRAEVSDQLVRWFKPTQSRLPAR